MPLKHLSCSDLQRGTLNETFVGRVVRVINTLVSGSEVAGLNPGDAKLLNEAQKTRSKCSVVSRTRKHVLKFHGVVAH